MRRRLFLWAGLLCIAAIVALVVHNNSFSIIPSHPRVEATSLSLRGESLRDEKVSKKLPVPVSRLEEPAWLTEARNDPDPRVRLNAIEAWARNPTDSLDQLTYALVDADEQVRARAQELLEEELSRR